MRRLLLVLIASSLSLACSPEVTPVPATQTVVRIEADAEVQAALHSLRVRSAAPQGRGWIERNDKSFAAAILQWPVEIVVLPRSEALADQPFEIIADALDANGAVLSQARALTGFVLREQRVLALTLSSCGGRELGFVCGEDAECLGPECLTCVDASCAQTPFNDPAGLPVFTPNVEIDASQVQTSVEGGPDTTRGPDADRQDGGISDTDGGSADGDANMPGPASCDQGSERGDAGTCADIDECARGLDDCDDAPAACVNLENGLGFSCACPTGYRGEGRGPDGCTDIDECMEQTDACDALAPCNNGPGSYACGDCPAGYSAGSGGTCQDLDECASNNGGCDMTPLADCLNQMGAPNTCRCPPGHTGNGVGGEGCVDENECLANNGGCDTSPMATCNNQTGAPRTCTCQDGSSGDGIGANGCVDDPDCSANSCQHEGRCIEGVNRFACDCSNTGYSGTTCQIDPCSPNPCGAGLSCSRNPNATASCGASCAGSAIGCQPGDACTTDAECRTGGDASASCDPTGKVCVKICPATTIVSKASLDAAKYCKEVDGELRIEPNFTIIDATGLPYLTRVRGPIISVGGITGILPIQSITIPQLQTVDGDISFSALVQMTLLSLPRLTTAKSMAVANNGSLTHVSLPQLNTVTGTLMLYMNRALERVDIGRLSRVGELRLQALCRLPWAQVEPISMLGTTRTIASIGCCNMSTDRFACGTECTCN